MPSASTDGISFFTKKTRLWLGRSQIICFQVAQPATEDRYYPFEIDEKAVHLLMPPRILAGEKIGYLRVQPLAEGKTRIGVQGAKLDIEIARDPALKAIAELNPQIVTPALGADVWGEFVVGVEQLSLGDPGKLSMPVLVLPSGKEITGHVVPDQKPSPHARWAFNVDTKELAPGLNKLVAIQKDNAGQEVRTDPIYVNVVAPDPAAMVSGLCKDQISGDRPANAGGDQPKIVNDDKYGQGMIVDNHNENPAWCLPVTIPKKGQYQLFVTARGDFASDALPTLGLSIDEENQPVTTVRLATTEWHRIPVGHPITIDEGNHFLSVRTRNGFSQGKDDTRALYLQKYELARVDHPEIKLASGNGGPPGAAPMMMMAMAGNGDDSGAGRLHVMFTDDIDGQTVAGRVDVGARCLWPDHEHAAPPRVELFVNKQLIATQTAAEPRFEIDPAYLTMGANTLELRATLPSGAWAKSVPFTVEVPKDFPLPKEPFIPAHDFAMSDPGWGNTLNEHQGDSGTAAFYTNGAATLKLPENLAGNYKLEIEARGDDFQGPAVMSVTMKSDGKETKLGEVPVGSKMAPVPIGQAALHAGAKELTLGFTNDLFEQGKGDRNLYVKTIRLVPINQVADTQPPQVAITYPHKGGSVGDVDIVVARVMDNHHVAAADLLIDGQPRHLDQTPLHGLGPVVFPLLTRDLKPGPHVLRVVAHDDAGNQGASSDLAFTVAPSLPLAQNKYARALFLLNRFGYGPDPAEIAGILTMGEKNWLESKLTQGTTSPAEENEQEWLRTQFPNQRDGGQVTSAALQYLLTDSDPVRARFVMWTENHFSTWISKAGTEPKAQEHASFLQLGCAPFFDLLFTSATSPAMLVYLDQRYSFAKRLNENYAREIMELHTLGVKGGYTQKDVTTLADLLTGWTLADEAPPDGSGGGDLNRVFAYDPDLNSGTGCRVLGCEFPGTEPEKRFDRVLMALELLSAHPSCAHFISHKLCEHYVSDPPPPALVEAMAQVYLETGGDIRAMLVAMSQHPDFWASPNRVASPIDFGVRASRVAGSEHPGPVNEFISRSGMGMFDRATPDGYPEADGYNVSSNALLQRWNFAKAIQNDFLASGSIPGSCRPSDNGWNPQTTQQIVDLAAVRLTGNVLSQASNDAAQKLLAEAPPNTDARLHALATFIYQLPESSVR